MQTWKDKKIKIILFFLAFLFLSAVVSFSYFFPLKYASSLPLGENFFVATHVKTPDSVKALYATSCAVSSGEFRKHLESIFDKKEVNSLVIDIKDYSGGISFVPEDKALRENVSKKCLIKDLREYIKRLHDKNIYVIGRISVFQDPIYSMKNPDQAVQKKSDKSVWKDGKGLSFVDPGSVEFHEYIISIAESGYYEGFDEINFDYIRFPSDGNMVDIYFPISHGKNKSDVIEEFFFNLRKSLKDTGVVMSADLFGMTTTNTDDLNIGQVLEKALPYFDFVCPMVYPSHYPADFNGWKNPNLYPYEIVKYSMDKALPRFSATTTPVRTIGSTLVSTSTTPFLYSKKVYSKNKMRPWLQDFRYGGVYGVKEVKAQIQAVYDSGLTSFMLWDPAVKYTPEALEDKTN